MPEKSKFTFVNDINEQDDFEKELEEELLELIETDKEKEERLKKARIAKRNRILKTIAFMTVLTGFLFIASMLWQADWGLQAIGDGLSLVFVLEFFLGWVLFVYNKNIFSPLIYGGKTFLGMFIGKRPKTDYYSYMKNIQDNQIPAYYYNAFFITSFFVLIPVIIIIIIVL